MRRCTRCGWSKPDACFQKRGQWGSEWHDRCLHCRTIGEQMGGMKTTPPPPPPSSVVRGHAGGDDG